MIGFYRKKKQHEVTTQPGITKLLSLILLFSVMTSCIILGIWIAHNAA